MTIYVDADACPVKSIIVEIARKAKIPVHMFIDTSHELNDGYSMVTVVDKGPDSVDIALMNKFRAGDVVVTQDFGVAALALGKSGKALNQNGLIFSAENIDGLLLQRHIGQKSRRLGKNTKGPPKRSKADDENFRKALLLLIDIE